MNTALNKKFFSYVIPSILAFALSGVTPLSMASLSGKALAMWV